MNDKLNLIQNLLDEGDKFNFNNFAYPNRQYPGQFGGPDTPKWTTWKTRVYNTTESMCAIGSPGHKLVDSAMNVVTAGNNPQEFERAKSFFMEALRLLHEALTADIFNELNGKDEIYNSELLSTNKVFIVHGHDSELKIETERLLADLGIEPVILHRQPDEGATVIEKFEKHSDVGYAFILLTPDEIAYTKDQEGLNDPERSKEKRARPNVIFEFGYFVGKLGRNRVCCLHTGDVVIPSDLNRFVYKKIDNNIESIALSLIKELKTAGYTIKI